MVTHDVLLRGATFAGGPAPVILERTDDDFLANILRDAASGSGQAAIRGTVVKAATTGKDARHKLFQPVHQTFHVVLLEAACDAVGQPRLDPRSIDSMGLVIRRVRPQSGAHDAWLQAGSKLRAWQELSGTLADADPDSARRPALKAGHPEIDRQLALLRLAGGDEPLTEAVAPLFLAPPEVCTALSCTLLYGLIPLASAERSEAPAESAYSLDVIALRLATYFKAAEHARAIPHADESIDSRSASNADLQDFILMLSQLSIEFDAFGTSAESVALMTALNAIALPYGENRGGIRETSRPAGDVLRRAGELLLQQKSGSMVMPLQWPPVTTQQADAIVAAAAHVARARFSAAKADGFVVGPMRFEDPRTIYQLRAFVRVKRHDGCPPRLYWSGHSPEFRIAPWYDNNPASPPAQVIIPEISDMSRIKPNVAFKMPEGIFNVLERNKKLDDLGKPAGPSIGIGWICGFNIPTITLCAFIALNILLGMFNIIFGWMAFVKICIPFPKVEPGPADN